MIISPPFLPARGEAQSEESWLDGAMTQPRSRLANTEVQEGSFPLSHNLSWHAGLHLQAPADGGGFLAVRAIADGEVVFASAPTERNADVDHGQNYNPFDREGAKTAAWTDNGCVVIKHTTEIGALGTSGTELVYYSVYMHLSELARIAPAPGQPRRTVQKGDAIWRKDEIGKPGRVYDHAGQIHFEISLDEPNLHKLLGRSPDWIEPVAAPGALPAPTADGRIDSIFGSSYIYLSASTPTDTASALPNSHLRRSSGTTLGAAIWVRMTYEKGNCLLESFDERGKALGAAATETDAEYNLYQTATARHNALPAADKAQSSPSGWYELLRFGRNVGWGAGPADKDPLPANAAHWRQVIGPQGQIVWADLNAGGSFKFSDADFLAAMGWNCVQDDESPNDQRCDSKNLKKLMRGDVPVKGQDDKDEEDPVEAEHRKLIECQGKPEVIAKLRRVICNFPCEWDKATIEARYRYVKELPGFKASKEAWPCLVKHLQAISFADLPDELIEARWRVHPREFVGHMRKCGWLSSREFRQLIPKHAMRRAGGKELWEKIPDTNAEFATNPIAREHRIPLNRSLRKWGIHTSFRMATFFGNAVQETMWLGRLSELGGPNLWYAPWYGRGFLQLTNPGNFVDYWRYRGRSVSEPLRAAMVSAYQKIAATPVALRSNTALQDVNFLSLTDEMKDWRSHVEASTKPTLGPEDVHAPSDSAGFYWEKNTMSKEADAAHVLERVNIQTDAGPKAYYRSQSFWKASATVNLPGAVNRANYSGINGFDARCVAYGYALAVLTEILFEGKEGSGNLWFPDGHLPRKDVK